MAHRSVAAVETWRVEPETAKPGWYADAFERYRYRYWDGERWTGYAANDAIEWDDVEPANAGVAEASIAPPKRGLPTAFGGYALGLGLAIAVGVATDSVELPGGRAAEILVGQLGLWVGLVGACVLVSRRRGTGSLRQDFDWRFRKADIGFGIAGAIAGRIVGGLIAAPIPIPSRRPTAPEQGHLEELTTGAAEWVVLVLLVCIGAPLIEELFFRGLMQPRLVQMLGAGVGLPVTAILFGAAHLTNWQGSLTFIYAASIAGGGLVLGLMRHVTGRLGPSTWAHFFFNAQAVALVALFA